LQRWLFFSSYAAIKTPNEKDYQRNELDEEFGVDLHYFDARMYDAQVGRFTGVDVYADQFTKLSPCNYAANNPYYFADPDGRLIMAIFAKVVIKAISKAVIKKLAFKAGTAAAKKTVGTSLMKFAAGSAKSVKATTAIKKAQMIGSITGGISNTARNWDQITKGGGINVIRAAGHFLAGSNGGEIAALGTPLAALAGMGIGGLSNVETDFVFDLEVDFWKSFSRGASSALAGKSAGKSFLKGADVSVGAKGIFGVSSAGTEKGLQTVFNNYDLYGKNGIKRFGSGFYWQSFAAGFAGGALKELSANTFANWQNTLNGEPSSGKYDFSLFSVGLSSVGGDITKGLALKLNKEYKIYIKKNKQDNWLSFFNGAAQLIMYHGGK